MIENAEDFQSAVEEFESWLPRVSSVVQQFGPISSDPKEIKKQLKEAEVSLNLTCLTSLVKIRLHGSIAFVLIFSFKVRRLWSPSGPSIGTVKRMFAEREWLTNCSTFLLPIRVRYSDFVL